MNFIGSEFSYWCGVYARDGIVTLVCFEQNSYYSTTHYTWEHSARHIVENPYSVLYTERIGHYKCVMQGFDDK